MSITTTELIYQADQTFIWVNKPRSAQRSSSVHWMIIFSINYPTSTITITQHACCLCWKTD